MFQVKNLSFKKNRISILEPLNFSIPSPGMCAVIGLNGSGKTTLLKILSCILPATSGRILYQEKQLGPNKLNPKKIGWTPASTHLPFDYSVEDILLMSRYPWHHGYEKKEDYQKVTQALGELEIEHKKKHLFSHLSSGYQKLTLISRLLAGDYETLIFDEPTAHLDLYMSQKVFSILKKRSLEQTVIIADHNLSLVKKYCDWFVVIHEKKVKVFGDSTKIWSKKTLQEVFHLENL